MAATGRAARADRLNERLRGAQRVNIADDDFGLNLDDFAAPVPSTSPEAQPAPEAEREASSESSAKRRKLGNGASAPARQTSQGPRNPYSLPNTSKESIGRSIRGSSTSSTRLAKKTRPANAPASTDPEPDDLESLPPPSSIRRSPLFPQRRITEEVAESPADKPGSGQRRSIQPEAAAESTTRLQSVLRPSSASANNSPTTYKSRRSDAPSVVRSVRSVRQTPSRSPQDDIDELSPDGPSDLPSIVEETPSREPVAPADPTPEPVVEEPDEVELGQEDQATKVGDAEAAKALGRNKSRRTRHVASPELGSQDRNDVEDEPEPEPEPQPTRRKPARPSPAKQKQGRPGPKTKPSKPAPKSKSATQPKKSKAKTSPKRKRQTSNEAEGDNDKVWEVTVQRFVNHRQGEDAEADPLQLNIPFANRSGETAVDAFKSVCDDGINDTVLRLQAVADHHPDASKKKEAKVKIRAIEAYREVLHSTLLNHQIRLDQWHSLRKRVRHVQKEKLALREEILQLKAEREQVSLRMDAVRLKHEEDTKESSFLLDTSNTMRDIDLAVATGREAPELSAKANKEAELANIELAVAQIADQASSAGPTGGLLSQIKDFNGLLKRAALALESR